MEDFMLAGMAFPHLFKYLIVSWFVYKILLELIKHSSLWQQVWHKPLFSVSLYLVGLSVICYWGNR